MNNATFRARLVSLLHRSKRAIRLYSGVAKNYSTAPCDYTEQQAKEWELITTQLLRALTRVAEFPTNRELIETTWSLFELHEKECHRCDTDIRERQSLLIRASETGDFVRAASLSQELVSFKARSQALYAAYHELKVLLKNTRESKAEKEVTQAPLTLTLTDAHTTLMVPHTARVIPLRRRM
jgi:hypothetical protein